MLGMMSFGRAAGGVSCSILPDGEIFYNRHFDCGFDHWETNAYGGDIEIITPSSIRLTATSEFSSITQTKQFPISPASYHLGIVVTECSGEGKFSYKLQDGTWHNPITFNAPGTYEADITVDQDIIVFDIGANNDPSFSAVFDGVSCMDASVVHFPDWWKIATLDDTDILGAWDFNWIGIDSTATARTTLAGTMPSFENAVGGPVWREGSGLSFGGGGAIKSPLPDGIDVNNLTVLIQVDGIIQNATLDAFYSTYKSYLHYTLQNGWGSGKVRWSCGSGDSTTIEVGSPVTSGIIATAGRTFYVDGTNIGEVPESAEGLTNSDEFILGAIILDDGRIVQMIRGYIQKVLIVNRLLTETEVKEIISNINGATQTILDMDRDGKPDSLVMTNGRYTVSEDEDSINIDIDGDKIADAVIPKR